MKQRTVNISKTYGYFKNVLKEHDTTLDLLHNLISGASSLSFAVLEFLCTSVYTSNSAFLIPRICTHLLSYARGLL
jgi:hypothetical protein